jgi:hypothetical protein
VSDNPYRGYRFPREIISHCVWLYFRFGVSFPDVEELMAARGVLVSYETVWRWCDKFGRPFAADYEEDVAIPVTSAIWTRCSSASRINSGERSIRTALSLTFSFNPSATDLPQCGSFASCCVLRDDNRA